MRVYLLKFNNYYNRIVKYYDTMDEYRDNNAKILTTLENVNFIENDGVNTTQVVNWGGDKPDYLIVTDLEDNIISRWFVLSYKKMSYKQLNLTLHRDLVVDYYQNAMGAPCFVEKGNIKKIDDPAIYNNEDMGFNQIKVEETSLPDRTGCPWIVGYIPRDAFSYEIDKDGKPTLNPKTTPTTIKGTYPLPITADIEVDSLNPEDWHFGKYIDVTNPGYEKHWAGVTLQKIRLNMYTWSKGEGIYSRTAILGYNDVKIHNNSHFDVTISGITGSSELKGSSGYADTHYRMSPGTEGVGDWPVAFRRNEYGTTVSGYFKLTLVPYANNNNSTAGKIAETTQQDFGDLYSLPAMSYDDAQAIIKLNNKILYDKDTKTYYRIGCTKKSIATNKSITLPNDHVCRKTYLDGMLFDPNERQSIYVPPISSSNGYFNSKWNIEKTNENQSKPWEIYANVDEITITLTQLMADIETTIDPSTGKDARVHLADSPYDMFCIPYQDGFTIYKGPDELVKSTSKFAGLFMAQAIPIDPQAGSGTVYDIQILPYCPIADKLVTADGTLDVSGTNYSEIIAKDPLNPEKSETVSILFWCDKSSFTNDLVYAGIEPGDTILEKKVRNLTEMYRISSPNYAGIFEFNPQKNEGLFSLKADCAYKPYNPYIHVSPIFDGLYGGNFNDARGLICGGDFSTAQVTSAWADYQMNNKTYQLQFDREITNIEVNNKAEKTRDIANGISGTLQGGASGAAAGAAGGPVGMIVGAAVGTITSAAGAITDGVINEQLRQEALDFKRDMFGYNMQNIQAIPQGLSKVSADNPNNKFIPFIEKYTCRDEERRALIDKLRYNGMTIMRIDKLSNYTDPFTYTNEDGEEVTQDHVYVKGRLIRVEDLAEDYHIGVALADEIFQGVFI